MQGLTARWSFYARSWAMGHSASERSSARSWTSFQPSAFARDLPSSHFHHFGVMLGIFTDKASLRPQVASTDTAAWNGRLGTGINEFDAVMVQRGWTQRRTEIQWALPRFVAKGNGALQWPKQLPIGL
jgi:hypothetical protein